MRLLLSVYLVFAVLAVGFILLIQVPGLLLIVTWGTLGLGYVAALVVLNMAIWLIVFAPAVLGAWIDWRVGAGIAAVTVAAIASFPKWVPDPAHDGVALLEAPFAAKGPVQVRSVDLRVANGVADPRVDMDRLVDALQRNQDLEWFRVSAGRPSGRFERKNGVLYKARETPDTAQQEADVIIWIPGRWPEVWDNAALSPWRVEDVSGYLIHDTRTNTPLARNLSLKMLRAVKPFRLEITGMQVDVAGNPRVEFVRAPYGAVTQNPDQTLEGDLRMLGLWHDAAQPALGPGNPTHSPAAAVDGALRAMLQDVKLAQHKGSRSRPPNDYERQVITLFNAQLAARVNIDARIDLIAQLERSKISRLDRDLIVEIAQENPGLMQRMVDLYYTDLAQDASVYPVLDRVVRDRASAPFAQAIGADRERFLMALGAGDRHQREFLIGKIHHFAPEAPDAILRTLFVPDPAELSLDARLSPAYRQSWIGEWWVKDFLEDVRTRGIDADTTVAQQEADQVMRMMLRRDDVAPETFSDFVRGWVATRRTPIAHDPELVIAVLAQLDKIGAHALHAALFTYFTDLFAHLPTWIDPPKMPDP